MAGPKLFHRNCSFSFISFATEKINCSIFKRKQIKECLLKFSFLTYLTCLFEKYFLKFSQNLKASAFKLTLSYNCWNFVELKRFKCFIEITIFDTFCFRELHNCCFCKNAYLKWRKGCILKMFFFHWRLLQYIYENKFLYRTKAFRARTSVNKYY